MNSEHECNDCGIMIPDHRPICTLCEQWYEARGLPLPSGVDPKNGAASSRKTSAEAKS